MKKSNTFLRVGMAIIGIMFLLKICSIHLPDFIEGLGFGAGIALELIGIYAINHDISKFRKYKRNVLRKLF